MALHWNNPEDIALELIERFPDKDPLSLRFTDLREMVVSLPEFGDDPQKSSEGMLEAIQMAWYEEWEGADGA
jgi:FeS assembly protein IscX